MVYCAPAQGLNDNSRGQPQIGRSWKYLRRSIVSNTYRNARYDLFLVRVRRPSAHEVSDEREYSGKVQRVVDGETHEFSDWHALIDHLITMLVAKSGTKDRRKSTGGDDE
jgi:hypothetical protein